MSKHFIQSPQHGFVAPSLKIQGSVFVGIVFQLNNLADVRIYLDHISSRYPDATHRCYAYVFGDTYKLSDAGEPVGTAGKPILFALQQSCYTDILVVVVRYFGGTLLGASGLVRAYGQCARDVLVQAPVEKKESLHTICLVCSYDDMSLVMQCVEKFQGTIVSQDAGILLQVFCTVNTGLLDQCMDWIRNKSSGRVEIRVAD